VFADLGIPNAEEEQTKVQLAFVLNRILAKLGGTQHELAKRLHTDQPKISALRNYRLDGLSVERLMGFLTALAYDVDIKIKRSKGGQPKRSGRIHVSMAA
ncbi:MAG: helix-turn-helix domain-containing protein, partial [Terriglobales bacterium]